MWNVTPALSMARDGTLCHFIASSTISSNVNTIKFLRFRRQNQFLNPFISETESFSFSILQFSVAQDCHNDVIAQGLLKAALRDGYPLIKELTRLEVDKVKP